MRQAVGLSVEPPKSLRGRIIVFCGLDLTSPKIGKLDFCTERFIASGETVQAATRELVSGRGDHSAGRSLVVQTDKRVGAPDGTTESQLFLINFLIPLNDFNCGSICTFAKRHKNSFGITRNMSPSACVRGLEGIGPVAPESVTVMQFNVPQLTYPSNIPPV